jgi:hypothetical protein
MTKIFYRSLAVAMVLVLSSCNRHYLTYDMVEAQLNVDKLPPDAPPVPINYGPFEVFKIDYQPNGLGEVTCLEKKTNKKVKLSINKDTTLVLIDKNGEKHRLYFDTVMLRDSVIYGLRSRMLGMPLRLHINQIDHYQVHAELSKVTPAGE